MISEDQKKEIDELVEEMKSEVKEGHTITDVWRQCENIVMAAYQLGKEHGRNEVRDNQQKVVNHDN